MAMRIECHAAVNLAAQAAGLKPRTAAQIDAIDARLRSTMRSLARTDPEWQAKTPDERLQAAAAQSMGDIQSEAARKVDNAHLQIVKTAATERRIQDGLDRGQSRSHALVGDLEQSDLYIKGIRNEAMGQMVAVIDAVKSDEGASFGRKIAQFLFDADNPMMRRDLAAEIFRNADGSTGNKMAHEGARAYLKVAEDLRTRFNAAGGDIGKLDYGYLVQLWDMVKVNKTTPEAFAEAVMPHVDRSGMLNEDGSAMTDPQVREFLKAAHETLSTDGLNKTEPGTFKSSGARANRGGDARQIHFKDGDSYLTVMAEFGRGSMYEAISGHVSGMARDIGLVERYGPDPNAQFKLQLDLAERADKGVQRSFLQRPETYWDVMTGVTATPQSARIAQVGMGLRSIQTAGKLGGAVISSITDVGTYFVTTGYNRLSYWDSIANIGKVAASKDTRDFLTTHGIIAETMAGDLNRWAGDNTAQNWAGRLANSTLKLSLLNAWTDTLRRGFQMTMMQGLARMSRTEWGKLSEWDRALMERRGLTADDWAVMQRAKPTEFSGSEHLTPEAIHATGDPRANEVVAKVLGLIQDEGEVAVINPDLATRAATTLGGTQSGTIRGELARSVMQFKAFPLAMVSRHWRRVLDAPQVGDGSAPMLGNRVAYTGALLVSTTALGAIALQAKQVIQGKDPIDMTGEHATKFWLKALAQGGGLSIVGDTLLNDPGGSPGGMAGGAVKTALGPVIGNWADAVLKLGAENVWQAAAGKPTHAGAETLTWAKSNLPLINIWYAKAAIDHMGLHALQENLSPGYLSKMKQRAKKEFGQDFWWSPGTGAPKRAPDVPKAVGK